MSKYTTELRYLVAASFDLGMKNYPIFDENYRGRLNQLIIDHYAFYEIGQETPARFVHNLNNALNEQMPYFNKLYEAALLVGDPIRNRAVLHTLTDTSNGTHQDTNSQSADLLTVGSDTPQSLISAADLDGNLYASTADRQDNHTAGTGSGSSSQARTQNESFTGFDGVTPSQLFAELRASLVNIDMLVIRSLAECFMQVY